MIELALNKIKVDETRGENVIIFREKEGERYLPVVIGTSEVSAIKMKLSGVEPPRPLTHDLLLNIVAGMKGRLEKVVIDRLENNTFYAKLYIRVAGSGETVKVDCRPSDSAALAVRSGSPVYTTAEVLDKAGVTQV